MKQIQFNRKQLLRAIYLACVAAALSFSTSAQAQTVIPASVDAPYSADLTDGGSFATTVSSYISGDHALAGDSTSATPSAGGYQLSATSAGFRTVTASGLTSVSNLGGAATSNFVETADISAGSLSGGYGNFGLTAFTGGRTISAYTGSGGYGYGGTLSRTGQISLGAQIANSGPGSSFGFNGPVLTFNAGDVYHFELDGSYTGNDLTLTLTVTDLNNPLNTGTVSGNMGTALTAQNFGVAINAGNLSSLTGTVSNFSVDFAAVPEPSDYALMLLGGAALLGVARRQKKATV